jgi:hypothetical protein
VHATPLVVKKAISSFDAARLLSMQRWEAVEYLVAVELAITPQVRPKQRPSYWLALAIHAFDTGRVALARKCSDRASGLLITVLELSLTEFHAALSTSSIFQLESALFTDDEQPFEEALRRIEDFATVFDEPPVDMNEIRVPVIKARHPLAVNPVLLLREAREHAKSGRVSRARRCLTVLDSALTQLVDAAVERQWRPPYPYGAILSG